MIQKQKEQRQFWVILVIVFLGFLGISMPYLIFPALFLNPEYSILPGDWSYSSRALILGMTLAAYPFGQFLGSPILGSLSDDHGRKKLLTASLAIAALCNLLTGVAIAWQNLGLLIFSRFAAGFMEGNIAIARAMAADMATISKHDTFGKINAAGSLAFLFGPLLGGAMSDKNLFQGLTASSPFYFIFIIFLFLTLISMLMLERDRTNNTIQKRSFWQRINLIKRLSSLFLNKWLRFLMIVSTWMTLAIDIFYEFGPIYLTVKWMLSPAQLILYNGVLCLALVIGNGWLPSFFSSLHSTRLAMIYSMVGFAFFLVGITVTDSSLLMILLLALSGLLIGVSTTLITVDISNAAPDDIQGEVMGVQQSLRVLGDAFICALGGVLLIMSSKLILIAAAAISAATAIYYVSSYAANKVKGNY